MAQEHSIQVKVRNKAGVVIAQTTTEEEAESEVAFSLTVGGDDQADVDVAIPFADIESFAIASDKEITVEINNPADVTQVIVAGGMWFWFDALGTVNPIADDITKIRLIRGDAGDAVVTGSFLVNS